MSATDDEIMNANEKSSPDAYAICAMLLAKGALMALATTENAAGVGMMVRQLEVAIDKLQKQKR